MIVVSQNTLFLLYLGFFLFFAFGVWLSSHLKGRKKETLPPISQLKTCEYCAFQYLAATGKRITHCPQCKSYNRHHFAG